jgi:iron(III) transport system substrate-binding protein
MMPAAYRLLCAGLFGILLTFAGPVAQAADDALVKAAEKEGGLVVYGCDPVQMPGYFAAFQKKYPNVKLTSYLAGCWQLYSRHVTEHQTGRQSADVIFSIEDVMERLNGEHLLERYRSPEFAAFPPDAVPENKDYAKVKVLLLGLTGNRDFTKDMKLPQDWFDFANPPAAWHGLISFYDPRVSSVALLVLAALEQNFGREKTAAIYKGLVASEASLSPTTPGGLSKMLVGQQPIMFYIASNDYVVARAKGVSLDFTIPTSGALAVPFAIGIPAGAPHPNAARLFIDFMMSDGQALIAKGNEYALRTGSKPPDGTPGLDKVKLLPLDVGKALAEREDLLAWWGQVTGIH